MGASPDSHTASRHVHVDHVFAAIARSIQPAGTPAHAVRRFSRDGRSLKPPASPRTHACRCSNCLPGYDDRRHPCVCWRERAGKCGGSPRCYPHGASYELVQAYGWKSRPGRHRSAAANGDQLCALGRAFGRRRSLSGWVQDRLTTRPGSSVPFRRLHLVHLLGDLPSHARDGMAATEQDAEDDARIIWTRIDQAARLHRYPAIGDAIETLASTCGQPAPVLLASRAPAVSNSVSALR